MTLKDQLGDDPLTHKYTYLYIGIYHMGYSTLFGVGVTSNYSLDQRRVTLQWKGEGICFFLAGKIVSV